MRALWLAIVACAVALGGAVGGVGAGELDGTLASGAPAVAHSASARVRARASCPELRAVTARPSDSETRQIHIDRHTVSLLGHRHALELLGGFMVAMFATVIAMQVAC
jgi:hypothetical protein